MNVTTKYSVGDRVYFDGCTSIKATVTGVLIRGIKGEIVLYQLAFMSNGSALEPWVEDFRIDGLTDDR